MTHTYKITGMTCGSCEAKVKTLLSQVKDVTSVNIDRNKEEAEITMAKHVDTAILKDALKDNPKYQLSEKSVHMQHTSVFEEEQK